MSDDEDVRVEHSTVLIRTQCDECEDIACSPVGARDLAARILAAADQAEANVRAIEAACADGHEWGSYLNGWRSWPDTKVTVRYCKREGCEGRIEEPGWVQFAGRLHFEPTSGRYAQQVACYGPGCERCDDEKLGAALRGILLGGMSAMEQAMFGEAAE